jgi:ergothioneine biosynthesis protein EgtB
MTREELICYFRRHRKVSEDICRPLEVEDYCVQTMEDCSPPKWHLGHVSWFFEAFVLQHFDPASSPHHDAYRYYLNSYYESAGDRIARARRGCVSRPTVRDIYDYRAAIDDHVVRLIETIDDRQYERLAHRIRIGINHEQQHQELCLADIKNIFWHSPLAPVYKPGPSTGTAADALWVEPPAGLVGIGFEGTGADDFCYDNERDYHHVYLPAYQMQSRLVTNGEYLQFVADGGYRRHGLWLSDGWATVNREKWEAPLYWQQGDGQWLVFGLNGLLPLEPDEPVCHVSFYEADAFARWAGARLPTEPEWENAAVHCGGSPREGNCYEKGHYHPIPASGRQSILQMYGDVWEWCNSAYLPYPGFRAFEGGLGEYNGKFMVNHMVLRGGSCTLSETHIRPSYRSWMAPHGRIWLTGIRLAK